MLSGYSLNKAPPVSVMRRASILWLLGYILSMPLGNTAMVGFFASTAAWCAMLSTPKANPLTMTTPALASSDAIFWVIALP